MSLLAISKIFGFQNFFMWSPFAKLPKMSDITCLENLRLCCVRNVVSETKPFSLKGLTKTLIPREFRLRHSRR